MLQFYPNTQALIDVYSFVSLIENVKHTFTLKTTIPQNYFIVCNQFWPHKNHLVVLQAVHYLKTQNQTIHVVFTGKHNDVRNEKYVTELKNYINKNNINSLITFTGFISREDQIELIKNSKAVIQPSLFEGWSTVIEDAKALNKYIIASDIEINKEQIQRDVSFFAVDDYIQLSEHLINCILEDKVFIERNYLESITERWEARAPLVVRPTGVTDGRDSPPTRQDLCCDGERGRERAQCEQSGVSCTHPRWRHGGPHERRCVE